MVLACLVNIFAALLLVGAVAYLLRLISTRRKAGEATCELVISPTSGLVIGAMLLGFQAIVQPQVRYRMTEEQKEEAFEDGGGDEPPGGRLFHRQLRQIRKGENIGVLTVKAESERIHVDPARDCASKEN
jgi:hypothetical protein